MKISIFAFIVLVAFVAPCAFYGWLESAVNMTVGLRRLFAPGATTVLFSPILLLFILFSLGVFVGGPLLATGVATMFGGLIIRWRTPTPSPSFARWFVLAGSFVSSGSFSLPPSTSKLTRSINSIPF